MRPYGRGYGQGGSGVTGVDRHCLPAAIGEESVGRAIAKSGMTRIADPDTGASLFFDHRDPAMVAWLGGRRVD
jgi:hypothetical protein